jgi:hypothetical protein
MRSFPSRVRDMTLRLGRRGLVPGLIALVLLASPAIAGAHLRSGTVAVDYRASVFHARIAAYSAQIFQSDRALGLTIRPRHVVTLVGYLGEPVFRLDSAGLWINAASETAVVLKLIKKSDHVVASSPRWRLQRGRRSVIWQDTRAQGLPPGVSRGTWSVPLIVDGRQARLDGELRRFSAPLLWPWLALLAALLAAGTLPFALRRRELAGPCAIGFGVAAAVAASVILVAFAFDAYASPGTWIIGIDVLVFLGIGGWALVGGPQRWHVAAAIGLGLVALAVGLLEGAIFLHPIVLAILPASATRFVDVIVIGAGLNAAALGGLFYLETANKSAADKHVVGLTGARAAPRG